MAKKTGKVAIKKSSVKATKKTSKSKALISTKVTNSSSSGSEQTKQPAQLLNVWQLTEKSAKTIWEHRKLFFGITLVYGLMSLILVQSFASSTDITNIKNQTNQLFTGHLGALGSGLGIFAVLAGSASNNGSTQAAGAYQLMLGIITSLAVIWALRQVYAGAKFRIRDSFYNGMYPLVPFILVMFVIGLQLIPLLIGSSLYNIVVTNGIAVGFIEKSFWAILFFGLTLVSFYMLSSSVFALYIVTLPQSAPKKALKSARDLVRGRRWTVLRKILWLPLFLAVAGSLVMMPVILLITPLTKFVLFLVMMFALVAVHTYLYVLYRELLDE